MRIRYVRSGADTHVYLWADGELLYIGILSAIEYAHGRCH